MGTWIFKRLRVNGDGETSGRDPGVFEQRHIAAKEDHGWIGKVDARAACCLARPMARRGKLW